MDAMLSMKGIKKRFGATVALGGVDLEVRAGEVLALVGENGAGKSTLMKVLSGAHAPDGGEMHLEGEKYQPRNPLEARAQGVAMIYQELSLAPHLSVAENILLGVEPVKGGVLDLRGMEKVAKGVLAEVGLGHVNPKVVVGRLSVAERQLVEIARALALNSKALVFDEPTSSLTQQDIGRLFELVRKLRSQGKAIIYISHFLEEVRELSSRYEVLRDGRSVGGGITGESTNEDIIGMMVGRDVKELYPRSARTAGEVILEIDHLAGKGKPVQASLRLRRGEVVGIAGLVGAGRTELLRTIFGLDAIGGGKIKLANNLVAIRPSPAWSWRQRSGLVSEDRKTEGLALGLSIAENLTMTKTPAIFAPSKRNGAASRWADALQVKRRDVTQSIGELSGGNQQKVAIARLLFHGCEVLLLDEPTRGIDVASKAEIYRVIDQLARDGKAVLMVSSYLPELLGVCDRVAVMCRGVLGEARPVAEISEHSIMLEATGLQVEPAH